MPRTSNLETLNRPLSLLRESHGSRSLDGPALNRIDLLLAEIEQAYRDSPKDPSK